MAEIATITKWRTYIRRTSLLGFKPPERFCVVPRMGEELPTSRGTISSCGSWDKAVRSLLRDHQMQVDDVENKLVFHAMWKGYKSVALDAHGARARDNDASLDCLD